MLLSLIASKYTSVLELPFFFNMSKQTSFLTFWQSSSFFFNQTLMSVLCLTTISAQLPSSEMTAINAISECGEQISWYWRRIHLLVEVHRAIKSPLEDSPTLLITICKERHKCLWWLQQVDAFFLTMVPGSLTIWKEQENHLIN